MSLFFFAFFFQFSCGKGNFFCLGVFLRAIIVSEGKGEEGSGNFGVCGCFWGCCGGGDDSGKLS